MKNGARAGHPRIGWRRLFALGCYCAAAVPLAILASDADVSEIFTNKRESFGQKSTADPLPNSKPFDFALGINITNPTRPNTVLSATFTPPGKSPITITPINEQFFYSGGFFASKAELDSAFPNGTYNFDLETQTPPTTFQPTSVLTGDTYPNTPKVLNTTWAAGALQANLAQNFVLQWNGFVGSGSKTAIDVAIGDSSGATVYSRRFAASATSVSVPVGILQPDQLYRGTINFLSYEVVQNGATPASGNYVMATDFLIAGISGAPVINSPLSVKLTVGQPFIYMVTATNFPSSFEATNLPPGLTFNPGIGVISGTPTTAATTQVQLGAANTAGTGAAVLTLTVQPSPSGPVISSSTSATGRTGQPFTFQVLARGTNADARVNATGLPPGLKIAPASGLISGTPTQDGGFAVTLTLTQGNFSTSQTLQLTFTSDPKFPVITSSSTAALATGEPFSYTIAAPGGDPLDPTVFTIIGTLPPGLTFDPQTGKISGTYSVQAQRGGGGSIIQPLSDDPVIDSVQLFADNSHGTATQPLIFLPPSPNPVLNISTRVRVQTGDNVLIGGFIVTGTDAKTMIVRAIGPSLPLSGTLADPWLQLYGGNGQLIMSNNNWQEAPNKQAIIDSTVAPPNSYESAILRGFAPGAYTAVVRDVGNATGIALVEVYDLASTSTSKLANISTRGVVETGDKVMIGGFIVGPTGTGSTQVIARAIGPSLPVAGALADPVIELHDSYGSVIGENDDWKSTQQAAIEATGVAPTNEKESAIVLPLTPGSYTAIVRGNNNGTGVGLVEVYALQ